jgi:hypothetical protein
LVAVLGGGEVCPLDGVGSDGGLVGDVTVGAAAAGGGGDGWDVVGVCVTAAKEYRFKEGDCAAGVVGFERAESYNFRAAMVMALSIKDCETASNVLRLLSDRL